MDPHRPERAASPGRMLAAAVVASTLGALPAMLIGGLAVLVREELGFDEAALGAAVSAFFVASVVLSIPSGLLSERTGPKASMFLGAAVSVIALLGVATLVDSWATLVVWLFVGGAGNTLTQVAANHLLATRVRRERQGLSFGVKQASIPLASMLAGLALPLVGLTIGWHWAFVLAASLVILVVALLGRPGHYERPRHLASREGDAPLGALVVVATAAGLGTTAGNGLVTFTVESAVYRGFDPSMAGLLLTVGSLSAISVRIVGGWVGDRIGTGSLLIASGLLTIGGLGYVGLALAGDDQAVVVLVTLLAFAGGWGYQGLIWLAVSRTNRTAPATAMGIVRLGPSVGAMVGPLAIGALITAVGYPAAWSSTAVMAFAAAALMLVGRWLLRRSGVTTGSIVPGSAA